MKVQTRTTLEQNMMPIKSEQIVQSKIKYDLNEIDIFDKLCVVLVKELLWKTVFSSNLHVILINVESKIQNNNLRV